MPYTRIYELMVSSEIHVSQRTVIDSCLAAVVAEIYLAVRREHRLNGHGCAFRYGSETKAMLETNYHASLSTRLLRMYACN